MCIQLELNSGTFHNPDGIPHTGYGFYAHKENSNTPLFSIDDLSTEPRSVLEIIHLLEDDGVSLDCFKDFIENFTL